MKNKIIPHYVPTSNKRAYRYYKKWLKKRPDGPNSPSHQEINEMLYSAITDYYNQQSRIILSEDFKDDLNSFLFLMSNNELRK